MTKAVEDYTHEELLAMTECHDKKLMHRVEQAHLQERRKREAEKDSETDLQKKEMTEGSGGGPMAAADGSCARQRGLISISSDHSGLLACNIRL